MVYPMPRALHQFHPRVAVAHFVAIWRRRHVTGRLGRYRDGRNLGTRRNTTRSGTILARSTPRQLELYSGCPVTPFASTDLGVIAVGLRALCFDRSLAPQPTRQPTYHAHDRECRRQQKRGLESSTICHPPDGDESGRDQVEQCQQKGNAE